MPEAGPVAAWSAGPPHNSIAFAPDMAGAGLVLFALALDGVGDRYGLLDGFSSMDLGADVVFEGGGGASFIQRHRVSLSGR